MRTGSDPRVVPRLVSLLLALIAVVATGVPAGAMDPDLPSVAIAIGGERQLAAGTEPFAGFLQGAPFSDYGAKWRGVIGTIAGDIILLRSCRADPESCPPAARRFLAVVEAGRQKNGRARLGEVNRAINLAIEWTSDVAQHRESDVWSSPLATFESGKGDCEDYAVAKYLALLEVGIPADDLRVMVVRNRTVGDLHAVLMARLDHEWLVLDNARLLLLTDHDALWQYAPLVAVGTDVETALASVAQGVLRQP